MQPSFKFPPTSSPSSTPHSISQRKKHTPAPLRLHSPIPNPTTSSLKTLSPTLSIHPRSSQDSLVPISLNHHPPSTLSPPKSNEPPPPTIRSSYPTQRLGMPCSVSEASGLHQTATGPVHASGSHQLPSKTESLNNTSGGGEQLEHDQLSPIGNRQPSRYEQMTPIENRPFNQIGQERNIGVQHQTTPMGSTQSHQMSTTEGSSNIATPIGGNGHVQQQNTPTRNSQKTDSSFLSPVMSPVVVDRTRLVGLAELATPRWASSVLKPTRSTNENAHVLKDWNESALSPIHTRPLPFTSPIGFGEKKREKLEHASQYEPSTNWEEDVLGGYADRDTTQTTNIGASISYALSEPTFSTSSLRSSSYGFGKIRPGQVSEELTKAMGLADEAPLIPSDDQAPAAQKHESTRQADQDPLRSNENSTHKSRSDRPADLTFSRREENSTHKPESGSQAELASLRREDGRSSSHKPPFGSTTSTVSTRSPPDDHTLGSELGFLSKSTRGSLSSSHPPSTEEPTTVPTANKHRSHYSSIDKALDQATRKPTSRLSRVWDATPSKSLEIDDEAEKRPWNLSAPVLPSPTKSINSTRFEPVHSNKHSFSPAHHHHHHSPSTIAHSILKSASSGLVNQETMEMDQVAATNDGTAEALRKLDGLSTISTASPRTSKQVLSRPSSSSNRRPAHSRSNTPSSAGGKEKERASYHHHHTKERTKEDACISPKKTRARSLISAKDSQNDEQVGDVAGSQFASMRASFKPPPTPNLVGFQTHPVHHQHQHSSATLNSAPSSAGSVPMTFGEGTSPKTVFSYPASRRASQAKAMMGTGGVEGTEDWKRGSSSSTSYTGDTLATSVSAGTSSAHRSPPAKARRGSVGSEASSVVSASAEAEGAPGPVPPVPPLPKDYEPFKTSTTHASFSLPPSASPAPALALTSPQLSTTTNSTSTTRFLHSFTNSATTEPSPAPSLVAATKSKKWSLSAALGINRSPSFTKDSLAEEQARQAALGSSVDTTVSPGNVPKHASWATTNIKSPAISERDRTTSTSSSLTTEKLRRTPSGIPFFSRKASNAMSEISTPLGKVKAEVDRESSSGTGGGRKSMMGLNVFIRNSVVAPRKFEEKKDEKEKPVVVRKVTLGSKASSLISGGRRRGKTVSAANPPKEEPPPPLP
ncbi:hypothetical protein CROQUDRAFT_76429, partial [Cronartium quercuum f. sp. fusiforme G11]